MDLVSLMNSLAISEPVEEQSRNISLFGAEIDGHHTDIVFATFTDRYLIIATQYEKLGALLHVSIEQSENGIEVSSPVYTVSNIFGSENIEQIAAARYIAEKLNIQKPLKIFLCMKNYKAETAKALVETLTSTPKRQL